MDVYLYIMLIDREDDGIAAIVVDLAIVAADH